MATPVSLSKLVSAWQYAGPGVVVQVDTRSGELVEGPPVATASDSASHLQPVTIEFDELECAKRFCETVVDPNDRRRVTTALAGARPLESFENMIFRVGVAHEWFPFRDRQVANALQAFLAAQRIPFADDLG